ncbi:hypothetical protein ACIA8G_13510 [Lentzea sp. NPDC051213]|uniref:hypothetical protein n=1 Tax=Lentzea sp. NPDC051213 TaxID=3364126 RepID=UPI0037AE5365
MRKLSVLVVAVMALLSLVVGTASASSDLSSGPNVLINPAIAAEGAVKTYAISPQALSCGAGNMCAWPVSDGSSSRCSWGSADPDWQLGSIRCSWSSSRAVWAVANNGQSTAYAGVCLYAGANYGNWQIWVRRGFGVEGAPGVRIRSHRWVSGTTC